ncbi:DUF58 domain-containing protein [Bacillus cihuensis]|uniref:DUF58 domain-containing protein n=1 Tax=Bacillus cihuensis TaxID=1208599 RepID=UPI00041128C9|nr:DUF58 domain-containing protein [Bacillus cihuensis]
MMQLLVEKIRPYVKVIMLICLVFFAFVFAMFQGGFLSWFLLFTFLPFALCSIGVFFYPIHKFTVTRSLDKTEFRAGETIEVRIEISRKDRFPLLFLLIEEELDGRLGKSASMKKVIIFPWFRKSFSLRMKLHNLPRGDHSLSGIRLKTGDIIGLFDKEAKYDLPKKILVWPAYYDLAYKQLENFFDRGEVGSVKKMQREYSIVSGVREYQPGDQMSWINWKATANKNAIMTKEFDEQKNHDVYIILDEESSQSFEDLVVFAASFAHALLKKGVLVGYAGSAMHEAPLAVRGGDGQRQRIFYRLAKTEADEKGSLLSLLGLHQTIFTQNAAIIIITSHLTRRTVEQISAYKTNQSFSIVCIKREEPLTIEELAARQSAYTRGMRVSYLDRGHVESGLVEVVAQ